jgi:hypothetical protein
MMMDAVADDATITMMTRTITITTVRIKARTKIIINIML